MTARLSLAGATLPAPEPRTWPLVVILAIAPWPFGSNLPWASGLLAFMAASVLGATAAGALVKGRPSRIPGIVWLAAIPFAGALAWGWLQASTWLSPEWAHPAWLLLEAFSPGAAGSVALDRTETLAALTRLFGYGCLLMLAARIASSEAATDRLLSYFVYSATLVSAYGLVIWLNRSATILWFPRDAYPGRLSASFINPNNFATYANLAILANLTLLSRRLRTLGLAGRDLRSGARRIMDCLLERNGHLVLCLSALSLATLGSQSRGGLLSLGLALLAFFVLQMVGSGLGRRGLILAAVAGMAVAAMYAEIAGTQTLERFSILADPGADDDARAIFFVETKRLVALDPWLGHGLGNFERAYRYYQEIPVPVIVDKAHNTWLETAAELGLPAGGALLLSLLLLVATSLRRALRSGPGASRGTLAVAAAVLVGAHALVDFSLQIPAVAVVFAVLLGLGVAEEDGVKAAAPSPKLAEEPRAGALALASVVPAGTRYGAGSAGEHRPAQRDGMPARSVVRRRSS